MASSSEVSGEAFNIAFGSQVNLKELVDKINELLEKDVSPTFGPERAGDIKHSNACIDKAKNMLGYQPDYSFSDGLELAVDWYKENL